MKTQLAEGTIVDVVEHVDEKGAVYYVEKLRRDFPVAEIVHGPAFKGCCTGCDVFGKNLSCPPASPTLSAYIGGAKTARGICLRLPQEYFGHLPFEERHDACFAMARDLLVKELLKHRKQGHTIAGSGPCLACETCAIEEGSKECRQPDRVIYSLESLGVNVVGLMTKCFNIDLEWSSDGEYADFVSAVGAVFVGGESLCSADRPMDEEGII